MQTFFLSWPPSTNSLWRAFRGRNILSAKARVWHDVASKELICQKARPISGPVQIELALKSPTKRLYDLDNRIKAVLDLLVKNGIIEDDNNQILKRLVVSVDGDFVGATISVMRHEAKT